MNHISKNTNLNENQFEQIDRIIKENPKILSSPDLLKINRCVSYMTFILKEICEYVCAKTYDETPLYSIRKLNGNRNILREQMEYLNKCLAK